MEIPSPYGGFEGVTPENNPQKWFVFIYLYWQKLAGRRMTVKEFAEDIGYNPSTASTWISGSRKLSELVIQDIEARMEKLLNDAVAASNKKSIETEDEIESNWSYRMSLSNKVSVKLEMPINNKGNLYIVELMIKISNSTGGYTVKEVLVQELKNKQKTILRPDDQDYGNILKTAVLYGIISDDSPFYQSKDFQLQDLLDEATVTERLGRSLENRLRWYKIPNKDEFHESLENFQDSCIEFKTRWMDIHDYLEQLRITWFTQDELNTSAVEELKELIILGRFAQDNILENAKSLKAVAAKTWKLLPKDIIPYQTGIKEYFKQLKELPRDVPNLSQSYKHTEFLVWGEKETHDKVLGTKAKKPPFFDIATDSGNTFSKWVEEKYLDWQIEVGGKKPLADYADYLNLSKSEMSRMMTGGVLPFENKRKALAKLMGEELFDVIKKTEKEINISEDMN